MANVGFAPQRILARDLYMAGSPPSVICKKLGIKPETMNTWRTREKWAAARLSAKSTADGYVPRSNKSQSDIQGFIIQPEVSAESARCRSMLSGQLAKVLEALDAIHIEGTKDKLQERCNLIGSIVASAKVVHGWDQESAGGLVNLGSMKSAREAIARQRGEIVDVPAVVTSEPLAPSVSSPAQVVDTEAQASNSYFDSTSK